MGPESIAKVQMMIDDFGAESPHLKVIRTLFKCGHETMAEARWLSTSNVDGYMVLLDRLAEFERHGKRGLTILVDVSVVVRDDTVGITQAPWSSQARRPRVRPQATPRPRNTATNRQLEAMPAEVADLQGGGNWSSKIIETWTCTAGGCDNEGKLCYFAGPDLAVNHAPIIRPVLAAWSDAIRLGLRTEVEPSPEMHSQMMIAKHTALASPRRRVRDVQQTVAPSGQPINIYNGPAPVMPPVTQLSAPTSSPLRIPSGSPELSTIEKVDAFIAWCKTERCWRGEEAELDDVRIQIREHGESVEGISNAAVDEWLLLGLKIGYRKRLRVSAKKWIAAGMPVPGVI
jgi:hypothetical protein